ncbi:MAG: hypothetical protein GC154_06835 [bacterium]|nr:hypothetical protein [bacterium]
MGAEAALPAQVLMEEINKRGGAVSISQEPDGKTPAITIISREKLRFESLLPQEFAMRVDAFGVEGYTILTQETTKSAPRVWVAGDGQRGLLYGVGRLLRALQISGDGVSLPGPLDETSSPRQSIRGHQLGYRAAANSYDAWSAEQYEQYIRELILFGANSIENIPFQDDRPSPVMKSPRDEMNLAISEICKKYDIQYWVWVPADFDLNDAGLREKALEENAAFYRECPRLDAIFVPGGDPGDNHPRLLLPYMEALSKPLMETHPGARMWISLQGFDEEQVDYFYQWLNDHQPDWLGGVVAGPSSPPIPETRLRLPARYKLRHYPDITHTVRCQYPVPWWDPAFAFTLGREPVNPMPVYYAQIARYYAPYTDGFLSYSDGVNDDVNKAVWSQIAWDPDRPIDEIVLDYARFFFGAGVSHGAAAGILALERNWRGALRLNGGVETTLSHWRELERRRPELNDNWRWQMMLLRANYDAYDRRRLIYEETLEDHANNELIKKSPDDTPSAAMDRALKILAKADEHAAAPKLRQRIIDLCEALNQSIGLQTSVEKYHASGPERGAVLDFIDHPLNDRWWLEDQFTEIRLFKDETEQWRRLETIRTWEHPGPGSYYDDIGNVAKSPHVIRGEDVNTDPEVEINPNPDWMWWNSGKSRLRPSWITKMDWPLGLRYAGLDPHGKYVLRMTGYKDALPRVDGEPVKPTVYGKEIGEIKEFPVPADALKDGIIEVTFDDPYEPGVNWRQESRLNEVWLIKTQ